MEHPFDTRTLLNGIFDFQTCERPNGTRYGTAGTCRKGAPVSAEDIEKGVKERADGLEGQLRRTLNPKAKKDLQSEADQLASLNKVSGRESNLEDVQRIRKELKEETDKFEQKMKDGKLSSAEVEKFVLEKQYLGDPTTAKSIIIGVEETTPAPNKTSEAEMTRYFAQKFAENEVMLRYPTMKEEVGTAIAVETKGGRAGQFSDRQAKLLSAITGETFTNTQLANGLGSSSQLELRSFPSKGFGPDEWSVTNMPWAQTPGVKEQIGSRRTYMGRYDKKMQDNMRATVENAVRTNPNLKSIVFAGDKAAKGRQDVINSMRSVEGSKMRRFTYMMGGSKQTGTIIDVGGKGKTFFYDYGVSVNARGLNNGWGAVAKRFIYERTRLEKGHVKDVAARRTVRATSQRKARAAQETRATSRAASSRSKLEKSLAKARADKDKIMKQVRQRTSGKPTASQQAKLSSLATEIRKNTIELDGMAS